MKNRFTKKLLLLLSSATILVYGTIYACGGGDWDWFFDSNFAPEAFVDQSYSPLFLSGNVFYDGDDSGFISRFNDEISEDWIQYLGSEMTVKDVNYFLLDSSENTVNDIEKYYKNGIATAEINQYQNRINLKNEKVKAFIQFLALAKQVEEFSLTSDPWSYTPIEYKVLDNKKLLSSIKNKFEQEKTGFLKNRYWFQYMKALFYSRDYNEIVAFFDQTAAQMPKNDLYYRGVGYVAGMHFKNNSFSQSNYLFSLVFEENPKMRKTALYNFKSQDTAEWNETLKLAKNNKELASLWAIYGYYNDEIKAIKTISALDPKNPNLDFLLTRAINKIETQINGNLQDNSIKNYREEVKKQVGTNLTNLISSLAASKSVSSPYLWYSAEGYIHTLTADYKNAEKAFVKAEKAIPDTQIAKEQLELLRVINRISAISNIKKANVSKLTSDIRWLTVELSEKHAENLRYEKAAIWAKEYLSKLYQENGESVMAELFQSSENYYKNQKNIDAMKSLLAKNSKSDLEQIVIKQYYLNLEEINYFESVMAFYQDNISASISFMEKSGDLKNHTFLANPFNGFIKDCHDCEHERPQKKQFTKIEFLQTLQTMQQNLNSNIDSYNNALLLGNAFYNSTFHGNGRVIYEGKIMGEASFPGGIPDWTYQYIGSTALAKKYYEKALSAAENDEQRAKITYMLAKCERNDFYNTKYLAQDYYSIYSDKVNFLAWNGFKTLKNEYKNTKYYQEVLQECGYFATYIEQN